MGDHVKGEVFLERAAFPKALDLAVDDLRVDCLDGLIIEAEALDRAGGKILHADIGLGQQIADDFLPAFGFQVQGDGFLVGVEQLEIPRIIVRLALAQAAAGVAEAGVFHLHDLRAQPCQGFRAGRTGFELGEIDDLDAGEEVYFLAIFDHGTGS